MTEDEFRKAPEMRLELQGALNLSGVQYALAIVKSRNELVPLPLGCTGIDAGRAHEERRTRALVVAELFELIKPMPDAPPDREPEGALYHRQAE